MSMSSIKRMASQITGAGISRIKFDPSRLSEIEKAVTKDDVRALIKQKAILIEKKKGVSRAVGRIHDEERRLGRAHKTARRRGTHSARAGGKKVWVNRIRAQRELIKSFKKRGLFVSNAAYRETYLKIKGGAFPDRSRVLLYLTEKGYLKSNPTKEKK
ncbi:MAG: 50S ribosomal protein L19e [Candidatus Micrarchaeia archaeon]